MSQVWLAHDVRPGPPKTLHLRGDSDARIVKGLTSVLLELTSDKTPREIIELDIGSPFARLGLASQLTINRPNVFYAVVYRIKQIAVPVASPPYPTLPPQYRHAGPP